MQGSTCLSLWVENIGKPPPSRFPDSWFVFGKQSPGLIMLSHIRLCSLFKLNCTFNMCACAKIMKALRTSRRCLRTAAEKAELPPEPMKYLGSSAHNMHLALLSITSKSQSLSLRQHVSTQTLTACSITHWAASQRSTVTVNYPS